MKFSTNKERGNTGLGKAIAYFASKGYVVSIPLNDTQVYDLVVDIDEKLLKVQVKATSQVSKYGVSTVNLTKLGGVAGKRYGFVKNDNIDLVFIFCGNGDMFLIPKEHINEYQMNLNKTPSKYNSNKKDYSKFLVSD